MNCGNRNRIEYSALFQVPAVPRQRPERKSSFGARLFRHGCASAFVPSRPVRSGNRKFDGALSRNALSLFFLFSSRLLKIRKNYLRDNKSEGILPSYRIIFDRA